MIKLFIKTNSIRKEVTADITDTPAQIFENIGANVAGTAVNLNGVFLSAGDLNSSFEELGVNDGSAVNLNSVVKADGANV